MPGDPLRAKFIAENFLENAKLFNKVRNNLGYTGIYKGKEISVLSSGMGVPSIGIYSYELFSEYEVDNIIRIGTCGGYDEDISVRDVVVVNDAFSDSLYAKIQLDIKENILPPDKDLTNKLLDSSKDLNIPVRSVRTHTTDIFYGGNTSEGVPFWQTVRDKYNCSVVEMEAFGLFSNAIFHGKKAACICTVSDSLAVKQITSSQERETAFTDMMKIALEATLKT
jgi:purine-nucleoside phosphorylase